MFRRKITKTKLQIPYQQYLHAKMATKSRFYVAYEVVKGEGNCVSENL